MIVMKFGGSSVANAGRIRHVADIVTARLDRNPVLVLSAMGDTTDHLLEAAGAAYHRGLVSAGPIAELHLAAVGDLNLDDGVRGEVQSLLDELTSLLSGISLIRELTPRTRDYLQSFGERLSTRIAAAYLRTLGMRAAAYDAWQLGFVSNSNHGAAELLEESWDRIPKAILPLVEGGTLPVVTGFIARDPQGTITTLGRGGSDLSATMIAAACKAEEAQVWKDVDGILTADPRIVKDARPVETVTYEEAAELAYFGAQVLHPRAMLPCMKTGTPMLVKNSYNPGAPGTRIVASLDAAPSTGSRPAGPSRDGTPPRGNSPGKRGAGKKPPPVRAITSRKNVTLVDLVSTRMLGQYGFLAEVFSIFAQRHISVDMVATSEVSVSLTLDTVHDLPDLRTELSRIASVEVRAGKAIVTIVGNVRRSSEILARAFRTCEIIGVPVQMVSQGASKVNISFIVDDTEVEEVIRALHIDFFDHLEIPGNRGAGGNR
jgi:aspartate kinase